MHFFVCMIKFEHRTPRTWIPVAAPEQRETQAPSFRGRRLGHDRPKPYAEPYAAPLPEWGPWTGVPVKAGGKGADYVRARGLQLRAGPSN